MAIDYEKMQALDQLLASADLSNTSEDGVRSELPDGYYLAEVKNAELKVSKSGNPMVGIEYATVEDGKKSIVDEQGYAQLVDAPRTANQKIFVNYVLSNELQVEFFVADMLKFQDPETNESFFTKDDFKSAEGIENVCEMLKQGGIIYIAVQTVEKRNGEPGETEKKFKPISWKRARQLELM